MMKKVFLHEGMGVDVHDEFSKFVNIVNVQESDYIVVAGGDNAMLSGIRLLKHHGKPFIGLNYGHVGFLMNDVQVKTEQQFNNLIDESEKMNLWMVNGLVEFDDGYKEAIQGFNDIYFRSQDGQALRMKVSINNISVEDEIIGDGFIVSTPQGSTGYNRAARGKIIRPGSPIIQMTPLACTIGDRRSILDSFVEPDDVTIKVEFLQNKYRQPQIMFDGQEFSRRGHVKSITFTKSPHNVDLMFHKDFNFYEKIYRLKFHQ